MRLTRYTDYALRVLIYLGLRDGELATIREIAAQYSVSENHLMKVVHNLAQDGYVETVRGRFGGMRLAKDPEAISVGEVVRRCEEDLNIVECFDRERNTCPIAGACALTHYLDDALSAFFAVLDKKTLADILAGEKKLRAILGC
jgi:Rrf2 family nitric oxide-sensitive transcriptional repressor